MKYALWGLLAVVLAAFLARGHQAFGDHSYAAAPFSGTVVDGTAGEHVEGAVVLAHWEVSTGGLSDGEGCVSELAILETKTDAQGHYSFPGWGPRKPGCGNSAYFRNSRSPRLLVFKPGYIPTIEQNQLTGEFDQDHLRRSEWDGKTLYLERFSGTPKENAEKVGYLSFSIDEIGRICCNSAAPWTQMPLMYAALQQQALDFQAGHFNALGSMPQQLPAEMKPPPCPPYTETLNLCYDKSEPQAAPCPPAPPGRMNHQTIITHLAPPKC